MRLQRWAIGLVAVLALALAGTAQADEASTQLNVDAGQSGRAFEGIGALSTGGTTKLLYDYPEPQRSRILDYLFKPNYGASLQHLKVEIGGDGNAGPGSEATHMRTRDDLNLERGYEWWLMKEAKRRNPDIELSALEWSVPGWVGDGDYFSRDNIDYILKWIKGAKRRHGLTIDYVGTVNEPRVISQQVDWEWVKQLKRALVRNGLRTKLVVNDDPVRECCPSYLPWDAVDAMLADPELARAVDVIGSHYAGSVVPEAAKEFPGVSVWSSEDGPWTAEWNQFVGGSYAPFAVFYNRNYIDGRMTATHIWNLITSYYDNQVVPNSGLMKAVQPWSGHFQVQSPIWITAHTTQFTHLGWRYLDDASKALAGGGSVVTLRAPRGGDHSAVFETMEASASQTVDVRLGEGVARGRLHVWRTTEHDWFSQQADVKPVDGRYSLRLEPGAVYTVTTTSGQRKGGAPSPAAAPHPFPYADDFESGRLGQQPRYLTQLGGSFELTPCVGGRGGRCVEQAVGLQPVEWFQADPTTMTGDDAWTDYAVDVKLLHRGPGTARLFGRIVNAGAANGIAIGVVPQGYYLFLEQTGRWQLGHANKEGDRTPLARGHVKLARTKWHDVRLAFSGSTISAAVDGTQIASVSDATYDHGMAALGSGWNRVQFDDLRIGP